MDFLRNRGLPIPMVYKWDATASNPARSAYMIMEKVKGREVYHTWYTMSAKERRLFVKRVVKLERKMFDIEFPASGSLYYKRSLGPEIQSIPISTTPGIPEADQFVLARRVNFSGGTKVEKIFQCPKVPVSGIEVFIEKDL